MQIPCAYLQDRLGALRQEGLPVVNPRRHSTVAVAGGRVVALLSSFSPEKERLRAKARAIKTSPQRCIHI